MWGLGVSKVANGQDLLKAMVHKCINDGKEILCDSAQLWWRKRCFIWFDMAGSRSTPDTGWNTRWKKWNLHNFPLPANIALQPRYRRWCQKLQQHQLKGSVYVRVCLYVRVCACIHACVWVCAMWCKSFLNVAVHIAPHTGFICREVSLVQVGCKHLHIIFLKDIRGLLFGSVTYSCINVNSLKI